MDLFEASWIHLLQASLTCPFYRLVAALCVKVIKPQTTHQVEKWGPNIIMPLTKRTLKHDTFYLLGPLLDVLTTQPGHCKSH